MTSIKVGIVDYGAGNTSSLMSTLKCLGITSILSSDHDFLMQSSLIIIPGVGSYSYAMEELKKRQLTTFLKDWVLDGRGLIGICLGMQILTEIGYEGGIIEGLGIIEGKSQRMANHALHTGWDKIKVNTQLLRNEWIFDSNESYVYFNHSYYVNTHSSNVVASSLHHPNVPAVIRKHNTIGFQFHPEKSQSIGRRLMYAAVMELANGN